ncbi:MAG: carboxynorspermidine decarboxylase [Elusimicrobiota bacterium]|nr:carboxynorspermidine decarboxylase [Elusimicrobiota bacterium]
MKKIEHIYLETDVRFVLALKCFSVWQVFDLMKKYMNGTTSSSLFEAKLGYEKFGKDTQIFSTAYSDRDIAELKKIADKVIFNSVAQFEKYREVLRSDSAKKGISLGIRINPHISNSPFDLADPARKYSRLGVSSIKELTPLVGRVDGAMFHYNCENESFESFSKSLDFISDKYGKFLQKVRWVSLGGGISWSKDGYPIKKFCDKLKAFGEKFCVGVYLEPGEAAIAGAGELVCSVLDIVKNVKKTAIVDASVEPHMLDMLIYRQNAKINEPAGQHEYIIGGRSCLAGDVFGTYKLKRELSVGSVVRFADAAGYTMVKKNWFNGLQMPSIVIKRLNGKVEVVREYDYKDFINS